MDIFKFKYCEYSSFEWRHDVRKYLKNFVDCNQMERHIAIGNNNITGFLPAKDIVHKWHAHIFACSTQEYKVVYCMYKSVFNEADTQHAKQEVRFKNLVKLIFKYGQDYMYFLF